MAGLVAIISEDRRTPVSVDEIRGLADAYSRLRPSRAEREVSAGEWARVTLLDGDVAGELVEDRGSWMLSVGAMHTPSPLHAPLAEFDGQFAAIRYDANRDELVVLTDPFAMQALYVARRGDRTYVSTSATTLARHLAAEPEPLARKFYLRTGYIFGPITHWRGVERMDPGTALTFSRRSARREVYWRPVVDDRVRSMSLAETVDHCIAVGEATVQRHLRSVGRFWADLTGGFDSRMVTALLSRAGLSFDVSTNGYDDDLDVKLARQVADTAGLEWRAFRLPPAWEPDDLTLRHAAAWGDGSLDVLQLADVLWNQRERAAAHVWLVAGGGGEHFNAFPWLQEYPWAGRSRRVHETLAVMRWVPRAELSFLRDSAGKEIEAYARQQFSKCAALFSDHPATTQYDAVYAYKSTGHFGAYRSANEAHVCQVVPCYYRDVFTTALSANHRWRNGHRLQRGIITRLNRSVAAVPVTQGGTALPVRAASAHHMAPYYTKYARAATRKVRQRLRPVTAGHSATQSLPPYSAAVRRLRENGVLDPSKMHTADDYHRATLDALVDAATHGQHGALKLVGRIATVELAVRGATV